MRNVRAFATDLGPGGTALHPPDEAAELERKAGTGGYTILHNLRNNVA